MLGVITAAAWAQPGGTAGAFTRLGFGARGQGMGNALSAIPTGTISSYYNPALSPFQRGHVLHGSYSFLALDRQLNQVSYTQRLTLTRKGANKFREDPDVQSYAGISAGWTNAGDANIQGYDNDGFKTGTLSVFENQFYFNIANRFSERFSAGFNFKFYYSGLYKDVTSSGFGVDVGVLYSVSDALHIGVVAQELVTKYKWDTSSIYDQEYANNTADPFARIFRLGAGYLLPGQMGTVEADVEMYDSETYLMRLGGEYNATKYFTLRAGVERLDLSGNNIEPRPTAGFTIMHPVGSLMPVIHYAFILEPVAPVSTHVLSVAVQF